MFCTLGAHHFISGGGWEFFEEKKSSTVEVKEKESITLAVKQTNKHTNPTNRSSM